MFAKESRATLIVISGLVAIGPMSTDMYLPALPAMRDGLNTSMESVQLTLSLFLVGFAIAQLFCGPLSDRFGRKPIILGGIVIFILASIGCALANTIEVLLLLRVLQAIGGCVGPVLGRAIVRDIYGPSRAAQVYAYLASIMALAPAVAPIIGGWLSEYAGWRSVFYALGVFASVGVSFYALRVEETLSEQRRQAINAATIANNFGVLLGDRTYLGYVFMMALTYSGLFAFLSAAPFVLVDYLQIPARLFGVYFFFIVIAYIAGNMASVRWVRRSSSLQVLYSGAFILSASALLGFLLAYQSIASVWAIVIPMSGYCFACGLLMPQAMNGALRDYPEIAGTASSLLGFTQMGVAALLGALVGALSDGTGLIMFTFIAAAALGVLFVYWLVLPPGEKSPSGQ